MENNGNSEYNIASLSEDDLKNITELENTISSNVNNKIVLIAYQPSDGSAK